MKKGDQVFVSFLRAPGPRREGAMATVLEAKGDLLEVEIPPNAARRLRAARLSGVPKGPAAHGPYWLERAPQPEEPGKAKGQGRGPSKVVPPAKPGAPEK